VQFEIQEKKCIEVVKVAMGLAHNGHKHPHRSNCFYFKLNAEKSPRAQQRSFRR